MCPMGGHGRSHLFRRHRGRGNLKGVQTEEATIMWVRRFTFQWRLFIFDRLFA